MFYQSALVLLCQTVLWKPVFLKLFCKGLGFHDENKWYIIYVYNISNTMYKVLKYLRLTGRISAHARQEDEYCIIMYQVSKFIHSSILLVKRGSRESHEIQLLTA